MSMSRRWCFTVNNFTPDHEDTLKTVPTKYLCYGKETGDSGTPHLQGFVIFTANKRLSALKKLLPTAHWEVTQGTSQQAADYCKKEGDVYEQGEFPSNQGKRTDLDSAAAMIKEGSSLKRVAEEHPTVYAKFHRGLHALKSVLSDSKETDDVRGIWIAGKPGVGKSYAVRKLLTDEDKLYIKAQNKWWDGYESEEYVLLDDLDLGAKGLGHLMKLWTDRYKACGEIKGANCSLNHDWFFVTSNYLPHEIWDDDEQMLSAIQRRFHIITMAEHNRDDHIRSLKNKIGAL